MITLFSTRNELGASVRYRSGRGFVLDEERLRRIGDIIGQRLAALSTVPTLTFRVYRGSDYYNSDQINDVITEDNSGIQRITRLLFLVEDKDVSLVLDFDASDEVLLSIEGRDRDFVFLLYSDLRQYINGEVLHFSLGPTIQKYKSVILIVGMVVALVGVMLMTSLVGRRLAPPVNTTEIRASTDVIDKLNFLISRSANTDSRLTDGLMYLMSPFLLPLGLIVFLEERLFKAIYALFSPYNLFLLGKEKERQAQRQATRQKVFWGVIVSGLVGLVTGFAVWYTTTSK